jgi:phosphonatase-like hydrolase
MIELVVFDMAGTTVHDGDAVNQAFRSALAASGIGSDAALVNTVMGLAKPEAIRRLLAAVKGSFSEETVSAVHEDFVRRMLDHYSTDPSIREIPGARATFSVLRRARIKVALNTGFSRSVVDVLLGRLGWRTPEVIDAVVSSDEVRHGRPTPT